MAGDFWGIGAVCLASAGQGRPACCFSYENETVNHAIKPSQDGRNGGKCVRNSKATLHIRVHRRRVANTLEKCKSSIFHVFFVLLAAQTLHYKAISINADAERGTYV